MTIATLERSFVFYQSFHDMIALIPDMETQLAAYGMICAYAFSEIEPQTDNWVLKMVFSAAKPLIDSDRKRRENGKKGGRKPAATEMQTEAATAEQVTEEQKTDIPNSLVRETDIQKIRAQREEIPTILVNEKTTQEIWCMMRIYQEYWYRKNTVRKKRQQNHRQLHHKQSHRQHRRQLYHRSLCKHRISRRRTFGYVEKTSIL